MRAAIIVATIALALTACRSRRHGGARSADELFAATVVHRFELEFEPGAMDALTAHPKEWVAATFVHGGKRYRDVRVRWKGNRSRQGWKGKPSFKIRFDKVDDKQRFLGLTELVLNNLAEDPTGVREAVAYELHRAMGVIAPRTGWVELTVNGVDYGLYLDVEAIDKRLLRRAAGDDGKGLLYEGEFGCDLHPGEAARLERDGGDDDGGAAVEALARQLTDGPAAALAEGGPLDRDRVLAYLAVSTVIGDFDGYRHSHNYRIYREQRGGRWSFVPWGLDRTFKRRLSPLDSYGVIARRCFADPSCRADYLATLDRAAAQLDAIVASGLPEAFLNLIAPAIARDPRWPKRKDGKRSRVQLRGYLNKRPGELRTQVARWGAADGDRDGDGYRGDDCHDRDATIHPGALEPCDGTDRDCSGVAEDAPACACQPVAIGAVTFQACTAPRAWTVAESVCQGLGLHLARLDDDAQASALSAALVKIKKTRWWIGLSDRAVEGRFVWTDGTPPALLRWSSGQPDDSACGEDCATLKDNGTWADTHCDQLRPFACR